MNTRRGLFLVTGLGLAGLVVWTFQTRSSFEDPTAVPTSNAPQTGETIERSSVTAALALNQTQGRTLAGIVETPEAEPLVDVRVCAKQFSKPEPSPACTNTDEGGAFRLVDLAPTGYHVTAYLEGFVPHAPSQKKRKSWFDLESEDREDAVIVLVSGGAKIEGVVEDRQGGPVVGAGVCVSSKWGRCTPTTETDAKGNFRLWGPVEVPLTVRTELAGYSPGYARTLAPTEALRIILTPESVIAGRVVTKDEQRGVEGASVTAYLRSLGSSDPFWARPSPAKTRADGRFEIRGLRPGQYTLNARTDRAQGKAEEVVQVGYLDRIEGILVTVDPTYAVRGRVTYEDSKAPCAKGRVQLSPDKAAPFGGQGSVIKSDGRFHLEGLRPGRYTAFIDCRGHTHKPDTVVEITNADLEEISWILPPKLHISGRLVDPQNQAISGSVGLNWKDRQSGQHRYTQTQSQEDGTFRFRGLEPGDYEVSSANDSPASARTKERVVLKPGQNHEGLVLTVPSSGNISGRVVDADQNGVVGAEIELSYRLNHISSFQIITDAEGRFRIDKLSPQTYTLYANDRYGGRLKPAASETSGQTASVNVRANETATVELVVESLNGQITGQVVDPDGQPLPDIFVKAARTSSDLAAPAQARRPFGHATRLPAVTDTDGRFVLDRLPKGQYTVIASRPGGGEVVETGVASGTEVTLTLSPPARLAGVLVRSDQSPVTTFRIVLHGKKSKMDFKRFNHPEGRWQLEDLGPDTYDLTFSVNSVTARHQVTVQAGEAHEDIQVTLESPATVTGRVVDFATGDGLEGVQVRVRSDKSATYVPPQVTDAKGAFSIDVSAGLIDINIATGFGDRFINQFGDYAGGCRRRVSLSPDDTFEHPPVYLVPRVSKRPPDWGLQFDRANSYNAPEAWIFQIAKVTEGGLAHRAGLKVNDVVVAMDGYDVTDANHCLGWGLFYRGAPTLQFTLADGRTVQLTAPPSPHAPPSP